MVTQRITFFMERFLAYSMPTSPFFRSSISCLICLVSLSPLLSGCFSRVSRGGNSSNSPMVVFNSITPGTAVGNSSTIFSLNLGYENTSSVSLNSGSIVVDYTGTANCNTPVVSDGTSTSPTITLSNCTGDGTAKVKLDSGTGISLDGQTDSGATSSSLIIDNTGPTISIGNPTPNTGNSSTTFSFLVTFSDANTVNLTAGDVTVTTEGTSCDAPVVTNGSSSTPTVTLSNCTGIGSARISIDANVAEDSLGNRNLVSAASNAAIASTISCPTNYISIAGNASLGTADFCVMRFEAKDNAGAPVAQASGLPWVNITAVDAQAECESIVEGGFAGTFTLISNPEWMTIARDIENYAANWSGGSVGSGYIPLGHSDSSPSAPLAIADLSDPYNGTGNNSDEAPNLGQEQKRTHTLSSGFEIWDISGNVAEYVDWYPGTAGFDLGPRNESASLQLLSANPVGSLLLNDYKPSNDSYASVTGFGMWYGGSGGAARRGGSYSGLLTGLYGLSLLSGAYLPSSSVGFRCVYRP